MKAEDAGPPARGSDVGRYLVLGTLGQGGLGVVLAAYDPQLDRRVAIKLLHRRGRAGGDEIRARMLREARALARVEHPSIVAVHDAGFHEDELFIVMELVEGVTLRAWLAERQRTVAEIIEVFVQAGRGLAAAHAAGLVHRDFKPQNVLVGKDGRVRVADFGLARVLAAGNDAPAAGDGAEPHIVDLDDTALTQTGLTVGTPAYMAPEQFTGGVVDSRADQFAFCAALHEALHGSRPFRGASYDELARNVMAGRMHAPAGGRPVPTWLRAVVVRGLARDAAARHPSMEALLAALAPDRRRLRRLAASGAVLAALAVTALVSARRQTGEPLCTSARHDAEAVWGPPARARLERAFAAGKLPLAEDTLARVVRGLDRYTAGWVRMRTDACEATHYRGTQSAAALDLRMRCLDRKLAATAALIDVLCADLDADTVQHAVGAVAELPAVSACADTATLALAAPPPADPRLLEAVEALRGRQLSVEANRQAGRYREALALATTVVAEARATGYLPLLAEALRSLGEVQSLNGALAAAEVSYREALRLAAAVADDNLVASLTVSFANIVGNRRARDREATAMRPLVEVALARAGEPIDLVAGWLTVQAAIERRASHADLALPLLQQAAALRERALGSDSPQAAVAQRNLAIGYMDLRRYQDALPLLERVLVLHEGLLGPEHLEVGRTLLNISSTLTRLGRYAEARRAIDRSLAIAEKAVGPDHVEVANVIAQRAALANEQGDYAAARADLERALDIRTRALGPGHPDIAAILNRLGIAARHQGDLEAAQRYLERGLPIAEKTAGPESPLASSFVGNLALVAAQRGDLQRARALHERDLAITLAARGPDHPELADSLLGSANTLRKLGQVAEARRRIERALAIMEKAAGPDAMATAYPIVAMATIALDEHRYADADRYAQRALAIRLPGTVSADLLAETRMVAAMAAWELSRDRAANLTVVREARAILAAEPGSEVDIKEIDAWLRRRGH